VNLLSMVVVSTPDIGVGWGFRVFIFLEGQRKLIEAVFEDGFNAFVGVCLDAQSAGTGSLKAVLGVVFPDAHDAETGTETLFRMGAAVEDGGVMGLRVMGPPSCSAQWMILEGVHSRYFW
jgi:hypothetical protein